MQIAEPMKVSDVMSYLPVFVDAFDTVQVAAQRMRVHVVGALPVLDQGELVGMVTDRDLAIRVVAAGDRPAETYVHQVMTPDPVTCRADEPLEVAIERMARRCVRRIVVVGVGDDVRGIISVDDLVLADETQPLATRLLRELASARSDLDGTFEELEPTHTF